jgi:hypothetical protein
MKRRWFTVMGGSMILGLISFAFLFGVSVSDGIGIEILVYLVIPFLIGGLNVLGGASVSVGTVEWYQFLGIAEIGMGILVPIWFWLGSQSATSSPAGVIFFTMIGVASGLYSVFIGADLIRGGRYISLDNCEPGPILRSRS